jgi:predicted membrane channel-forming protein YqfA (hemolysin III family)
MHSVSPYPHTALAAWQLALIAIVAFGGVAVWLGAVFYAAREPRSRDHAAASVPAAESQATPAAGSPAEPETKQRAAA